MMRSYLGPGWIAAYAAGALTWIAIALLTGRAIAAGLALAGALGVVALANLIATGRADGGRLR